MRRSNGLQRKCPVPTAKCPSPRSMLFGTVFFRTRSLLPHGITFFQLGGGDKVRKWARCFQVGVFTRGIVSTQRVEGIHRWIKEGRLNRKKKLWQLFEALMVIVSELIIGGLREEARTTGSYRQRHELIEKIYPQRYAALKERLTTWGLDEQVKQMALAQEYRVEQRPIEE